ncbi:hypothetical protein [Flavobacterium sp.]|uniref:hypothetical protein n=1 Tax=Flavobacterium sp. TaxID=239 RepID=UPI002605B279|nr:hypothetical protein [Flavobacterium sp.]
MSQLEKEINKLLDMDIKSVQYINWFEESGGEVKRITENEWELYEVTQYGIRTDYVDTYEKYNLDELVKEVYSWT